LADVLSHLLTPLLTTTTSRCQRHSTIAIPLIAFFFFKCSGDHRDLHSFPTRRSSDLATEVAGKRLDTDSDRALAEEFLAKVGEQDRKSTRLNSSHVSISYAVFCLKKKKRKKRTRRTI